MTEPLYDLHHPHGRPTATAPEKPIKVSAVCAINAAGQVLVGMNRKRFVWDVPQGVVEAGELSHEAALRELEEETGLVADQAELELIGTFSHRIPEFVFPFETSLYLLRLPTGVSDVVRNLEPEKCEHLAWMAPCQLPFPRGLSLRLALTLLGR